MPLCGKAAGIRDIDSVTTVTCMPDLRFMAARMIYFACALLLYNMRVCADVKLAQSKWNGEPVIAQITFWRP